MPKRTPSDTAIQFAKQLHDRIGPDKALKRLPELESVTLALSAGNEALAFWRALREGESKDTVYGVIQRVRTALELAKGEVKRPLADNERSGIEAVAYQARKLKAAIALSSLPKNKVWLDKLTFSHLGLPAVGVGIGWRGITDVLDVAIELAQLHLDEQPKRMLVRRRSADPLVLAFVRHLDWQFQREFGKRKLAAVAHAANAVLKLQQPLIRSTVERFLPSRPPH
jgi:hypothetical protein